MQVPLQRVPSLLPPQHLRILAGDLARTRWTQTFYTPFGEKGASEFALRAGINHTLTQQLFLELP